MSVMANYYATSRRSLGEIVFLASRVSTQNSTSFTFSAVPLGYPYICVSANSHATSGDPVVDSILIDGVSATIIASAVTNRFINAFVGIAPADATSGDIVVSYSNGSNREDCTIGVWGLASIDPNPPANQIDEIVSNPSSGLTMSVDRPKGGVALANVFSQGSDHTYSNLAANGGIEDYHRNDGQHGNHYRSGIHFPTPAESSAVLSQDVTGSWSNIGAVMIAFAPG